MIEITILYPFKPGARFDHDYYETSHLPMALELLGSVVRRVTVTRGVAPGAPWPAPAFATICRFTCESLEAYQAAVLPHAARLQAVLVNYSDCAPVVMIGEVTLDSAASGPSGA